MKRGLLWIAALLLLLPSTTNLLIFADIIGFGLGAAVIAWEWMQRDRVPQAIAESRPIAR
jgi:hypothetical protein